MKKGKRGITALLICLLLLAVCPIRAYAAGKILPEQPAALTISYHDEEKVIPDAMFLAYRVADVDEYARMSLTTEFEAYRNTVQGLNELEDMDQDRWGKLAETLKGYVQRDELTPEQSGQTDENGQLAFSLMPGLYLVIGYSATVDDFETYLPMPFMVFLPGIDAENNEWVYAVTVSPKFEKSINPPEVWDGPFLSRKVLKVWDDEGYESIRPEEVTVQLLRNGEVCDTVILNKENNWRYAWDNLVGRFEWTVVEKELPDYAVSVTRSGITFTISNKYVTPVIGVDPPVQKRITGSKPAKAETFAFVMTALDASYPMPEGSEGSKKEITITGAGSVEFGEMVFEKPGVYEYTVSEVNGGAKDYTYDTTVYTITFVVTQEDGELKVSRTIKNSEGEEVTAVEFTNPYNPELPYTGSLWWPVPVLLCAGLIFVLAGILRRKKVNE